MTNTHKKHFGEPVYKKPVLFGKHYKSNNRHKESRDHQHGDKHEFKGDNADPVLIEQGHRHLLEKRALRNGAIANMFGILCWLLFCMTLLHFSLTQVDRNVYVATIVPVAGFVMICILAYVKKADIGKRQHNKFRNNGQSSGRNFRKSYKHHK